MNNIFTRFLSKLKLPIASLGFIKIAYCDYNETLYAEYIGKILTKKEFYNLFPDYMAYKVIKEDMCHYNYTYKTGFNKIRNFIPDGVCCEGGFYLSDITNIGEYFHFGENIAKIELTDNSLIYLEEKKIKVNELNITNIVEKYDFINNLNTDIQIKIIKQTGLAIRYITNPTNEMKLEAVKQNGLVLQHITNPTDEMKLEAVKQNGYAIVYIINPTDEMNLEAVKQNGTVIRCIVNPRELVQLEAVKHIGVIIEYIVKPSVLVQLEAVKQNCFAIKYIVNPSELVQLEAVKQNCFAIHYIANPSALVKLEAFKQNGTIIDIVNSTIKIKLGVFEQYITKFINFKGY